MIQDEMEMGEHFAYVQRGDEHGGRTQDSSQASAGGRRAIDEADCREVKSGPEEGLEGAARGEDEETGGFFDFAAL